jgi:hypothetical protein
VCGRSEGLIKIKEKRIKTMADNRILEALNNEEIFDAAVDEGVKDFNGHLSDIQVAILIENYRAKLFEALGITEE